MLAMHATARTIARVLSALLLAASAGSGIAQERPKLLVLGSAHFANPGNDQINMAIPDLMTPARQAEIEALVEQLAAYAPTHVAVEFTQPYQDATDKRYDGYRDGSYVLSADEADQIGLRLAARVGLERVHAVDWNGAPPGAASAYDWYSYGQASGHAERIAAILDPARSSQYMPALGEQSITQWMLQVNQPEALARSHAVYFDIARIGDGEELPGAAWVGSWYGRNLRIFKRIADLATSPDARIVVVFGQGHAWLLQQFARESGLFDVVAVADVLGAAPQD